MSQTSTIKEVTESSFAQDVVAASADRPVVVDFWAPWCGPCHQLSPILERVAARYTDDVEVVKLNIDDAPRVAQQYGIQGIPAVKAFRDGKVVAEFTGVQPEPAVERMFAGLRPSVADRALAAAEAAPDDTERERLLRSALEDEPGHPRVVVALAEFLADRGDDAQARSLLRRSQGDPLAERLLARLNLAAASADDHELEALRGAAREGDSEASLALGRALAAREAYEEALPTLLVAVADPAWRDEARESVLEVFRLLGDDHELVRAYRPKLAGALF